MKWYIVVFFIFGLLLLSVVVYDITIWMIVAGDETEPFELTKAKYYDRLPAILSKWSPVAVVNFIFSLISSFLFFKCVRANFLKKISWGLFVFSLLLLFWNLFSLM